VNGKQMGILWAGLLLIAVRGWASGMFTEIWETISLPGFGQPKGTSQSTITGTTAINTSNTIISV
jgi:hypothetical protein